MDDTKATGPVPPDGVVEIDARVGRQVAAVELEIRRLHARNRLLTLGLFAALAVFGGATGWLAVQQRAEAVAADGVIEARRIVLVGEDGRPRGEWSVDETGHASLKMYDLQQRERMSLSVRQEGYPGLSLSNAQGERRVALGLLPDETTTLVFADGAGVPRAVLGLVRGDAANLLLADATGVSRIGFGLDGSGLGSVLLPDEEVSTEDETDQRPAP